LSPSTIDNYFAALRKLYTYLVNEGVCQKNIISSIERVRDKRPVFARAWLTLDQVYQLMDVVNGQNINCKRNRAIIHLMSMTGLRCIEVSKVTFDDIQYDHPNNNKLQIQRKGSNEKSGQITIPDYILDSLKEYWDMRSDEMKGGVPMFLSHAPGSKGTALHPQSISKIVKGGLRNIGLDSKTYSCHSLRSTATKLARLAGSGLFEIQYMLGHSRPTQTEHYLRGLGDSTGEEGRAILNICEYARKQRQNNIK
jgi:integrase/recombinase XerC/integrase/recombinase XerD